MCRQAASVCVRASIHAQITSPYGHVCVNGVRKRSTIVMKRTAEPRRVAAMNLVAGVKRTGQHSPLCTLPSLASSSSTWASTAAWVSGVPNCSSNRNHAAQWSPILGSEVSDLHTHTHTYVCVCVCVCVCVHGRVQQGGFMHACVCEERHARMCVIVWACKCICECLRVHARTCTSEVAWVCVCEAAQGQRQERLGSGAGHKMWCRTQAVAQDTSCAQLVCLEGRYRLHPLPPPQPQQLRALRMHTDSTHLLNQLRAFSTLRLRQNRSATVAKMYESAAFFLSASVLLAFCAGRGAILMASDSSTPDVGHSCTHHHHHHDHHHHHHHHLQQQQQHLTYVPLTLGRLSNRRRPLLPKHTRLGFVPAAEHPPWQLQQRAHSPCCTTCMCKHPQHVPRFEQPHPPLLGTDCLLAVRAHTCSALARMVSAAFSWPARSSMRSPASHSHSFLGERSRPCVAA